MPAWHGPECIEWGQAARYSPSTIGMKKFKARERKYALPGETAFRYLASRRLSGAVATLLDE
jgi:hypothetical protein